MQSCKDESINDLPTNDLLAPELNSNIKNV